MQILEQIRYIMHETRRTLKTNNRPKLNIHVRTIVNKLLPWSTRAAHRRISRHDNVIILAKLNNVFIS